MLSKMTHSRMTFSRMTLGRVKDDDLLYLFSFHFLSDNVLFWHLSFGWVSFCWLWGHPHKDKLFYAAGDDCGLGPSKIMRFWKSNDTLSVPFILAVYTFKIFKVVKLYLPFLPGARDGWIKTLELANFRKLPYQLRRVLLNFVLL